MQYSTRLAMPISIRHNILQLRTKSLWVREPSEANSTVIDLAAFNAKAAITSALQQVKNAEQALHTAESSTQGLARCLHNAKQSLEEAWDDTQMVTFANTGIKHTSIAMANIGTRAVHVSLRTPQSASPDSRDWCSQPQP